MRIKEEFKKLGYFWRPSEPNKRLPGTLSISDGGNIELEVLHQLGDMSPPFSDVRFGGFDGGGKRIVGVIENNDIVNNKMVTLENCYYKSLGSGSLATSLIHADTVCTAIGNLDHSLNQDYDTITLRLKGAIRWQNGEDSPLSLRQKWLLKSLLVKVPKPNCVENITSVLTNCRSGNTN